MRVVLDTNVLISAFLFKGISAGVYDYCTSQTEVCLSGWIMKEFLGKLEVKFKVDSIIRKEIEEVIRERVTISKPSTPLPTICRDKDDNQVLQIAESTKADFIITGDKDLLILKKFATTQIVTPGTFSDMIINSSLG